jgi:hypothetical protein
VHGGTFRPSSLSPSRSIRGGDALKQQIIGGLALGMVFGASSYGVPQDAGMTRTRNDRQITVRINDYAHVKSPVLVQAEQTAGDILGKAGVDTIWVECQGGQTSPADVACAAPMTPLDFILNVLPRSMFQPLHPQEGVLGRALESTGKDFGFFAYIFYDSVKDCAGQFDLGQYLGDVFAHELGHLLLGTNSHSRHGLMCAFRSRKELLIAEQRGGLFFSSSETKRIQTGVAARRLAALPPNA